MRIIGKGRDFYDGALAFGADRSLVFNRDRLEDAERLSRKKTDLRAPAKFTVRIRKTKGNDQRPIECHLIIVIFAGKRYPGVQVPLQDGHFGQIKVVQAWSLEGLETLLAKNGYEMVDANRRGDDEFFRYAGMTTLENHFTEELTKLETNWMIENGKSIAIWNYEPHRIGTDRGGWSWAFDCDGLSDLEFAKAVDPYGAFQALSQWVGGVLPRKGKETVKLTDADLAKKHGYNHWSFRKPPQTARK